MENWLRRIRGAIGMGLTWALAWFAAGMGLLLVGVRADVPFPLMFGFLGFLAGATFSGVLGLVEGRRMFDQLSIPRFASWGAVGGVLLSGIFAAVTAAFGSMEPLQTLPLLAPLFGLAGAGCAAGTLAIARKAEDPDLLDRSDEALGLSDGHSADQS